MEVFDNVRQAVVRVRSKLGLIPAALFLLLIFIVYLILLPVILVGLAFGLVVGTLAVFAVMATEFVEDMFS